MFLLFWPSPRIFIFLYYFLFFSHFPPYLYLGVSPSKTCTGIFVFQMLLEWLISTRRLSLNAPTEDYLSRLTSLMLRLPFHTTCQEINLPMTFPRTGQLTSHTKKIPHTLPISALNTEQVYTSNHKMHSQSH